MEFKPQEIAKLVLGYLRQEKCHAAFHEFLSSSPYLKEHVSTHRRGKYVVTRVNGLSLVDYLTEYALIYSIVQEHVEASDYYDEIGLRTSLVQQLHYLLNSQSRGQSRTSTPIPVDVIIPAHQENRTNKSKFATHSRNILEPLANNSFEIINNEISATSIQSLPGNSSNDLSFQNSSKNKSVNVNKSPQTETDLEIREKSQKMCKEIFTQTFLEHAELIEKLAHNINKEVSAKSSALDNSSNFLIGQELDSTTIDTIIQRIAEDPIIVNSVEEMLGTEDGSSENHSSNENTLNTQDKAELSTSKERSIFSTPKKPQTTPSTSHSLKSRLRSSKKSSPNPSDIVISVEEHNEEVVQSIVAAALSDKKQSPDQEPVTNCNTQPTPVGEVILSDQPYDNFVHTEALAGPSNQNQIYVNPGGLLMMQPSMSSTCSNMLSAKNLQLDPIKPYYVLGNQPFNNVIIPQTPFKVGNVITEQEIMAMPTIIVCDTNQHYSSTQPAIMQTPVTSVSTLQSQPRTIAPKKPVQKAHTLSEYITLYQCNDPSSPIISQPDLKSPSPNLRSKANTTSSTKINHVKRKSDKKSTQGCKAVVASVFDEAATAVTDPVCNPSQEFKQDLLRNKPVSDSMPQIVTPKMTVVQSVKERRSRSTPRNSSHVRQLDFSTPEKWCPVARRANTSPKANKILENKDTPVKAPKSGTSRSIRSNLFKSPEVEFPAESTDVSITKNCKESEHTKANPDTNAVGEIEEISTSKAVKSMKGCGTNVSWDADLRAAIVSPTNVEETVQKQKRKRSEEPLKEQGSCKKLKEILNSTEEDGAKIEIALALGANQIEVTDTVLSNTTPTDTKNVKIVNTRRSNTTKKKIMSTRKIVKTCKDKQTVTKTTKGSRNLRDSSSADTKINNVEDVKPKLDQLKVTNSEDIPEKQYAVINRHVKSRIKKKCNMENSVKKLPMPEEIILTNITKIKSCEILDESKNKLILSPSKLNANKRTLVEMENRTPTEASTSTKVATDGGVDTPEATGSKFITPELVKTATNIPPSTAKCNIIPILETPVKFDSIAFPKTPSICSPSAIDTPFTKAVLDQLTGVDISTIPTPKFPITPNVPFTPAIEQSPFSNRATDYSTSSSYYQPSDTEQNKSLEQLIEECRKLDNQSVESCKEVDNCDGTLTLSISPCKTAQKLENSETSKNLEINELVNTTQSPDATNTSVTEKMKAFNHSMIGKKNLHLVKMFSNETEKDASTSSDTSSTGTSSSSSSDDSDTGDSDDEVKTSVKNVTSHYSLRSRKSLSNNSIVDTCIGKETKKSQNTSVGREQDVVKAKEKSLSFHDGLLQEMEEKRQRTIARFKNANSAAKVIDRSKQKKSKISGVVKKDSKLLTTSINKKGVSNKGTTRSTPQPKEKTSSKDLGEQIGTQKESKLENATVLKQVLSPTRTHFVPTKKAKAIVNDDKEIILHLSSDDENIEPSRMVEAVLLECSTSSISVGNENSIQLADTLGNSLGAKATTANEQTNQGDQEAETWVKLKGLMQMGIHLIPNKSAKKLTDSPEDTEDFHSEIKENISVKTDQSAKPEFQTSIKEKAKNLEKQGTEGKGISKSKKQSSKEKDKLNRSIEEGELVSDDDKSPKKETKFRKKISRDKKVTQRRISEPCRNDIRKESSSQRDRFKNFRELYKYRPQSERQSKEAVNTSETKKSLSSKNSKVCKTKVPDKNIKLQDKAPEKALGIEPKKESTTVTEKQVVQELDYQLQFDSKTYTEETCRVVHDYSKEKSRTLSDYNLDILTKKFSANVYIAEIDSEVEKFLTFTPFQFLLDVNPEETDTSSKPNKPYVSKEPLKNKKKPLNILYNQLIKPAEYKSRPSVLDDLYDTPETSKNYRTGYEIRGDRAVSGSRKSEKPEKPDRSKYKPSREKSSDEEQSYKKSMVKYNDHKRREEQNPTSSPKKSVGNSQLQVSSINQERQESACGDSTKSNVQETKLLGEDLQIVDGVIMLNANEREQKQEEHELSFEANDELMNYALVGSERIEDKDDVLLANDRKRKVSEDDEENQQGKKQKAEELLRNIDVDSFLKKLHGEM